MGVQRQATPGLLVTTIAIILLAIATYSVPWFNAIYILKIEVSGGTKSGYFTFGVLGYCAHINGTGCTTPRVGYKFGLSSVYHVLLSVTDDHQIRVSCCKIRLSKSLTYFPGGLPGHSYRILLP